MIDQIINYFLLIPPIYCYLIILIVLLACGLGLPIPEDITLVLGGLLAFEGQANVWLMIYLSLFGVLAGDMVIFALGKKYGPNLLNKPLIAKILHKNRIEEVKQKLHKKGHSLIFFARFTPGIRAPIYFTAGTLNLPFKVFLFYDGLASVISVPLVVYGAYHFGNEIEYFLTWVRNLEYSLLVFLAIVAAYILFKKKPIKPTQNEIQSK